MVLKIGGSQGVQLEAACADCADLVQRGRRLIIVHGGSERASELARELGHPPRFLRSPSGHSSRYTDKRTRDIFVQAVTEVNGEIEAALASAGVAGEGMSSERCAIRGERKKTIRAVLDGRERVIRDDYSGHVREVNGSALHAVMDVGKVPIIPPLAWSAEDGFLNVDGDRVASAVAVSLNADHLVLLSNVPGLLRDFPETPSLVRDVAYSEFEEAARWAQGRMKRKLIGVRTALEGGVERVVLADGRVSQPLRRALQGAGTWFQANGRRSP